MNKILLIAIAMLVSQVSMAGGDAAAGKGKIATCAACHGQDGNSQIPGTPSLAGQYADYLEQALREYRSGARQNPIMGGMVGGLSDEDIADIAAWYASQSGLKILPANVGG